MKKLGILSAAVFCVVVISTTTRAQVPILYYDFENNTTRTTFENSVEQAVNSGSGAITKVGGSGAQLTIVGVAGAGTFNGGSVSGEALSTSTGGWDSSTTDPGTGAGFYYQFVVNTSGFSQLSISFDNQASGTGPARVGVLYSTDGTTFTAATTALTGNATFSAASFDLSSITAINNQSSVTIRLYAFAGSASDRTGRSAFGSGGTFRIDNLTVFAKTATASKTLLDYPAIGLSIKSGTAFTPTYVDFTVNGSGITVALASNLNVSGTFAVSSGTLNCGTNAISGAGAFTLASGATLGIGSTDGINSGTSLGNIRVSGTRTFNSGANYNFNGSAAQVSGSGFPTTINNMTISNSAGVTLSANTTVGGVLALTSGDLDTTSSFTLFMGSGATSTGTGDVKGSVNRTDIGATTRSFGNPDVQITETTGTVSSITVKLVKGLTPNDFANAVKRIYTITANNGTLVAATVRLRYIDSELNSNSEATLDLWRKDATLGWQDKMQTARNDDMSGEQNWVELAGVAQFSDWVISGPSAPTDVAMMSVKATRYDKHVLVEWQTGYEVSNIGFNIYREKNGNLERITPEPVAGSALIAGPRVELKAGLAYSWWDDEEIAECGMRNAECENRRYWIEDIDLSGKTTTHGPFGVSDAAADDPLADQHRDQAMILTHRSRLLSALGRDASLAQTAEAATVPVEPVAKVMKLTAARMSIQSGVASQAAVKMSIQRAGWYRVEQADLVAAGLPSSADPTMLQLFADGKEVPMLVSDSSSTVTTTGGTVIVGGGTSGGATGGGANGGGATGGGVNGGGANGKTVTWNAIQFYGVGIDSPSTVNHVYWLVVGGQPGLRIGNSSAKGGPPAPSSFAYTVERRDRSLYFPALKNGGAEKWFGPLVYNAQPVDQSVTLQHVTAPGSATMLVSLQGFTSTAHSVRVLFNGVQVGTINFSGQQKSSNKFVIPASNVREGVNQIQLIGPAGTTDMSLIDFVQVTYAHSMTADTNALRIPVSGQQAVTVDGFTSSAVRVMDVTDASSPVELQTTVNSSATSKTSSTYSVTATAPGSGTRMLLAFASDQQKRPAQIAANQPSSYRDPSQRADYLVLTRKDLLGSFNVLADLRKNQGLTPLVIDVEDIYDEFNFGNKSPQAIKDFLAYAKTSWARAPRFVVLGGDATYDPKNYLGTGDFDLVPTRLVETAYNEAATDDWFVDVNGDAVPDMAIGRLPVRTASEATALVMKLVSYDSSAASNNVVLVADRNSSFDFEGADTQLRTLIPATMTVTDIRRGQLGDANARSQLLAALNQGARVVNFYGHGSTTVWTDAPILRVSDAAGLTNRDHLSLVVSMTCLNGYFFLPTTDSLGESLLKSQGGAIAVWASSGLTDANAQTVMSRDAVSRLFSGSNLTIGEVVALSKASVTNMDVRRTWILLGDPATRLR